MYSMVLLAALTTGVDTPDFGRHRGGGCCGCYGGYAWGGCYGGCYGGWGGCWGGCYGGCYGGGWGGCYGGGYAWGGYGGWGGWGGWGGYVSAPTIATYAAPVYASNVIPSSTAVTRSMYSNPEMSGGNRATVIVHLPSDARLIVDGKATRSTSGTRRFVSPPLEPGKSYHYNFEAKVERDGEIITIPQRVDVRAGQQREISLMPAAEQSAKRKQAPSQPAERKSLPERRVHLD